MKPGKGRKLIPTARPPCHELRLRDAIRALCGGVLLAQRRVTDVNVNLLGFRTTVRPIDFYHMTPRRPFGAFGVRLFRPPRERLQVVTPAGWHVLHPEFPVDAHDESQHGVRHIVLRFDVPAMGHEASSEAPSERRLRRYPTKIRP